MLMAANLLREEFPLAEKYLQQEDADHWIFQTDVCQYVGVGRFVLGLFEEIEVIDSPDFLAYLQEKIKNMSEKIKL